jgi:cytochrome c oxidase assembly protein subunit 15
MNPGQRLQAIAWLAAALTFPLIAFGAIVRLKGGGLGCPDWPLCWGQLTPLGQVISPAPQGVQQALEMGHRYVATTVGMLCIVPVVMTWRNEVLRPLRSLAVGVLVLVIVQGLLGALTVTSGLQAWSVAAHLLGGNLCLVAMVLFARRAGQVARNGGFDRLFWARSPLSDALWMILVAMLIGGLVSGSGASYHCPGWPLCPAEFPGLEINPRLQHLNLTHRLLAGIAGLAILRGLWQGWRNGASRLLTLGIGVALLAEVAVGALNALTHIPVPISTLHTALAALIVAGLTALLSTYPEAR